MWKNKASEAVDLASSQSPAATKKTETPALRSSPDDGYGSSIGAVRTAPSPVDSRSLLGPSLQIKGEISGNEDLQLDCSVDGTIRLTGRKLTVGATAKVVADIFAGEIVVLGKIQGNLSATDRIEIKKDGSVVGELATSRIMIEDGAYFKGTIAIDRKNALPGKEVLPAGAPAPEPKPALHISGGSPTLYLASSSKDRSGAEAKA